MSHKNFTEVYREQGLAQDKDLGRPLTPLEQALAPAFGDYDLESIVSRVGNLSDLDKAQLAFELLMLITRPKNQEVGAGYSLKHTKEHIQVLINRLM